MGDGILPTPRIIALYPSLGEENPTLLRGVYCLCAGGVVLSLLTTKAMMILSGTWEKEYEKYLDMILGSGRERNRTLDGIASWFTKTGAKEESK